MQEATPWTPSAFDRNRGICYIEFCEVTADVVYRVQEEMDEHALRYESIEIRYCTGDVPSLLRPSIVSSLKGIRILNVVSGEVLCALGVALVSSESLEEMDLVLSNMVSYGWTELSTGLELSLPQLKTLDLSIREPNRDFLPLCVVRAACSRQGFRLILHDHTLSTEAMDIIAEGVRSSSLEHLELYFCCYKKADLMQVVAEIPQSTCLREFLVRNSGNMVDGDVRDAIMASLTDTDERAGNTSLSAVSPKHRDAIFFLTLNKCGIRGGHGRHMSSSDWMSKLLHARSVKRDDALDVSLLYYFLRYDPVMWCSTNYDE